MKDILHEHPIIKELVENGVPVRLEDRAGVTVFVLDGFYKSGDIVVSLPVDNEGLHYRTSDRYSQTSFFSTLQDIVALNYHWWKQSRKRGVSGWEQPHEAWARLMERFGMIVKTTAYKDAKAEGT